MRKLWTIAKKELRGYFDHPTAYILLVVFLGINFFLFFRGAFLVGEASLRSMFDLMPWILLFFIPAVTMGALAEEKKHGTLEIVLSHPIHDYEYLLGKYTGNLLFVVIALVATAFVPITMMMAGDPDFGVVFAQYTGTVLLAAAMTAVGLFASALTRNQITAFIVATAVIFLLMLVGSEVVQVGLASWLASPLAQLAILSHYYNVTRGVIDLRDVVYFVSVAAAFLAAAYWLLLKERLHRGSHLYRNLSLGTVTVIAIAIVANLFGSYIPGRLDLTSERLYTLSGGTREILAGLDDVVTITLFASTELPTQVKLAERDVLDVLRDFERFSEGNVQVIRKHPDQSDEARRDAQQLGIRPVQFNVVRREELQLKQGWLGIAVQYADESEVLPFVGGSGELEYQLASFIWKLTRAKTPKLAFVTGHGEKGQTDYRAFDTELKRTYEVTTLDLSDSTAVIPDDVDALIVAGPKDAIDERSQAMMRDYVQADGRILYLGEGVDINLRFLFASAVPDSARDFVRELGVRLNGDLVFDLRSNESITVPGQIFNYVVAYPFWVRALPASDHAITRGLNSVFLPWPSSLDTVAVRGGRALTPLLTTSPYAGRQVGSFQIMPDQELAYDPDRLQSYVLAVALQGVGPGGGEAGEPVTRMASVESEGAAGSAGRDGDGAPVGQTLVDSVSRPVSKHVFTGPQRGRVVIVGDTDFLVDQFLQNSPENLIFALNALDWLTQTEALLGIRSKTPTPRPLVFQSSFQMQAVKYLNLIGVPLAFVLFGAARLLRRRRLTRREYGT